MTTSPIALDYSVSQYNITNCREMTLEFNRHLSETILTTIENYKIHKGNIYCRFSCYYVHPLKIVLTHRYLNDIQKLI